MSSKLIKAQKTIQRAGSLEGLKEKP